MQGEMKTRYADPRNRSKDGLAREKRKEIRELLDSWFYKPNERITELS